MLNKSGENGYSCLVPDCRGKTFSFPQLSVRVAEDLSYIAFIVVRNFPSIPQLFTKDIDVIFIPFTFSLIYTFYFTVI